MNDSIESLGFSLELSRSPADDHAKRRGFSRSGLSRKEDRGHGILRAGVQATYADSTALGRSSVTSGYSYRYRKETIDTGRENRRKLDSKVLDAVSEFTEKKE